MLSNLFRKASPIGWMPDADAVNAPDGALLRCDNLTIDERGALALRKGSSKIYSSIPDLDIHTVKTLQLAGFSTSQEGTYRFLGVNNKLYRDGIDAGATFDGTGDFAIGTDSYQAFIARGMTKKKFDGSTLNNWGISPPSLKPTLSTATATQTTVATFASNEAPAFVINEGTSNGFVTGSDGTGSGAIEMVPTANGRFSLTKTFASDTDLLNIAGSIGNDTDLFDIYFWAAEPKKVDRVTIMFGMGTGTDPFLTDYYVFAFDIGANGTTFIKDQNAYTNTIYQKYAAQLQTALGTNTVGQTNNPDQVSAIMAKLNELVGPVSTSRKDAQAASPAWAHLSCIRGQFSRIGGTAGRDWTTIRGFKVVYECLAGSTDVVRLDSAIYYGGGDRALTGTYRVAYRYVRDNGAYQEVSPMSPTSLDITLNQQALTVTIPAAALSGADSQVNQIWIYLSGGFLGGQFYRVAVTGSTANSSTMRIDEFAKTADGAIDAADRTRLLNQGFSIPGFTPNADMVISILKSEIDALIENETVEPNCIVPPDDIVAIAGPLFSRIAVLTAEGWLYISGQRRPSSFSDWWKLDLRQWGTPLWMEKTTGGIYVGMTGDIIRIVGTADESEDRRSIDLHPEPQLAANPPVDACVFTDQNVVIYRAADGLMAMQGASFQAVSQGVTTLLWRGHTRHDILPLNITTGRFRIAIDNHIMYVLMPEGDSTTSTNVIWRFDNESWIRTTYSAQFRSIHREPNGDLVAGDTQGNLWLLEDGNQDDGQDIAIELRTPIDDGGLPLNRKDPFDMQVHVDTGTSVASVSIYLEASTSPAATYSVSTSLPTVYRLNVSQLGTFLKAQARVTGSFNRFTYQAFNISYRKRPQMLMYVDTGAIVPDQPSRFSWFRQVEVDCISPVDLQLLIYIDDELINTSTVSVVSGKRGNYRVSLPRAIKGGRPRIVLKTTNADGSGDLGFEPYAIRVKAWYSGNESDKGFTDVWVGEQLS